MDDISSPEQGAGACLLPSLKRRNSGKRNLHKPWTQVEEADLVRLVEQADYRKQVNILSDTTLCQKGVDVTACSIAFSKSIVHFPIAEWTLGPCYWSPPVYFA